MQNQLVAIYEHRDFPDAGGLMSYGPNLAEMYRSAARYVDKILKGAKPADLPVEQPTAFDLVINLKTAKRSGSQFPRRCCSGRITCSSDGCGWTH
jgi:putative ABC transport system substrate-binding protein